MQLLGLSYNKYLQEIIGALEEDESFRSQLMSANASDIKVLRNFDCDGCNCTIKFI